MFEPSSLPFPVSPDMNKGEYENETDFVAIQGWVRKTKKARETGFCGLGIPVIYRYLTCLRADIKVVPSRPPPTELLIEPHRP
jgi:hypothetical protein